MHQQRTTNLLAQTVWALMAAAMLLQVTSAGPAQARRPLLSHHITKRSFFDLQCKGVYNKSVFASLDRICEDCYDLFREPQLHTQCRDQCFTTEMFKGCIEALQLTDDIEKIKAWIKQTHGAPPGL